MNENLTETQIAKFLNEYSPEIEAQLREARQRLCSRFTRGFELVFSNYNALVFGVSPTENARDAFISIAGYPRWVTLFFLNGAALRDPDKLLEGKGKQVRSVRLKSAADIDTPPVQALISQAMASQAVALLSAPPLATILKMAVAKRRPRRPSH